MKLKNITRGSVVALGMATAALGLAIPASAADKYCDADCYVEQSQYITDPAHTAHYEARTNNNQTGNGVTSWIWVWTDSDKAHVDYYLNGDGAMHQLSASYPGVASSMNLSQDVTALRVCGPNGWGGDVCSDWWHPKY